MFVHVRSCARQWRKKRKRNKEKHLGHRAILNVPGQRGGNITIYAAITQNGVLHQHAKIAPYNTDRILTCLDRLSIGLSRYWTNASRNWFHYSSTSHNALPSFPFVPSTWQWNGLWSPTLCYTPHSSYGGGLWPNRCRVLARMKLPFEKILPLLFCEGGHCLWCGRIGHIQIHEEMMLRCFFVFVFFSLCTILYLEYVLIFSLIAMMYRRILQCGEK